MDRRRLSLGPAHECVDRPHLPCPACLKWTGDPFATVNANPRVGPTGEEDDLEYEERLLRKESFEEWRNSLMEWSQQQSREILDMLPIKFNQVGLPDHWISFALVPTPDGNGKAYALSIRDDEFPGSAIIKITDEKLLAKLRSIKGQFTYCGLPVYYYEYCQTGFCSLDIRINSLRRRKTWFTRQATILWWRWRAKAALLWRDRTN